MEFRKTPWLATKKAMDRWMDGWMGPRNRISLVLPTIEGIQRNPS
jgi:P2-related tail formation protein